MERLSEFTSKKICRQIAEVAVGQGMESVVMSPGSRNAPLIMAFEEQQNIEKIVVIDERMAAFIALGRALITGRPVGLVCTSGTALLNYAPAVAEAYYQGLPLVIISADRPEQWIDQDDSQTIRQFETLHNFVKRSYDIPVDGANEEIEWYANRIVNDALLTAKENRKGPVHINVQISAPIGETVSQPLAQQRIIKTITSPDILNTAQIKELAQEAANKKILFIAGFMRPDHHINRAVAALSNLDNVWVMYETISNIQSGSEYSTDIDATLSSLNEKELEELYPDIVISVGGAIVSRQIKEFLRNCAMKKRISHWQIGYSHTTADCFKTLDLKITANAGKFLKPFAGSISKIHSNVKAHSSVAMNYSKLWENYARKAKELHCTFLENAPWSSLVAFSKIISNIPKNSNLFLSNGTPVRYAQLFGPTKVHASFCNRGVSGIEGQLATASGASMIYKDLTVAITGDMSLTHDIASLIMAAKYRRLRIIVINNYGGEIFRFIKSTSQLPIREKYLCAPPDVRIKQIAEASGLRYFSAHCVEELVRNLKLLFNKESETSILEVFVPTESAETLKQYMNIKQK